MKGGSHTLLRCDPEELEPISLEKFANIPTERHVRFVQNGIVFCFDIEELGPQIFEQGRFQNPVNREPLEDDIVQMIRERQAEVRNNEIRKYKVELHLFWDSEDSEEGCPTYTVDQLREFVNVHSKDLVRDLLPNTMTALNAAKKVGIPIDVQVQDPDAFINDEEEETENFAKLVFYVQSTMNRVQIEDFFGDLEEDDLIGPWILHENINVADFGELHCGFLNVSSISIDPQVES